MAIDSKRIAKNTIFLYARLILIFGVSLYTSRVVLDKLGVDDYGLYNVIYSVIGLLSFLSATLSSGTSRFITFDLGKGVLEKLKTTFSTALFAHIMLAGIILVLGETIGLWYVTHVMVIPPERFVAAIVVYQVSIFNTMLSIVLVPFTSEVMAHERMDVYAYLGILEVILKLVIVFILVKISADKLIVYAFLVFSVAILIFLFYVWFTRKNFAEVRFSRRFDKSTFRAIMKFSGWNIIANLSNTLMKQGVIMLFNIFFAPVVVAAQAVSNQISAALMQFVNGVRNAINPQVIKSYADERYEDSKRLTLQSAEYVFDLLLLMGLPMIMIMDSFMHLWLVDVPEYAVVFAQLIIVQDILGNFSAAFYTPMVAANKIEKNTYASVVLCLSQFGLMWLLFKMGLGPVWARYLGIIFCCIWSFVVKPYILWHDLNYTWREMALCIFKSMSTFAVSSLICYVIYKVIPQTSFAISVVVAILAAVSVAMVSFAFMNKAMKKKIVNVVISKFKHC